MLKRYHHIFVALTVLGILVFAFFLRSNLYLYHDFNLFLDQARDLMLTKEIVVDGNLALIGARSGLGGIFHGPLWLYMITPFFFLSQGDPFLTLVPLFLLVSLSIVLVAFFVGKYLYDTTTGLIFAFLLAMSPHLLEANMITTNAQVMPLVFLVYLFAFIQYLRGKEKYIILVALAIGLGFQFESAFSIFLIPWTVLIAVVLKRFPKKKYFFISIGVFLLGVSTFILFELRNRFLMTNTALQLLQGQVKPIEGYEQYTDLGFRVQDRMHLLLDSFFTPLFQVNTISMILTVAVLLGALFLFFWKRKHKKMDSQSREVLILLTLPVIFYLVYILYPRPLWSHYILPLVVPAGLLLAISLRKVMTIAHGKILAAIFLVVITFPTITWFQQAYGNTYNPTIDGSYLNQSDAVKKVYADAKGDFGYFTYTTAILTYNMDYLIWYEGKYHQQKAVNKKLPITYLIMFPAPSADKGAHDFWKKNVIRTEGKVLDRWVMRGGIIVEKLQIPTNEPEPDPNYYQNLLFR